MSSSCDTLHFSLPAHGDSVIRKMNALREEHQFCDITLILGRPSTSAGQSVHFHGHRVVLAASSDFLRDQFLLHEDQAEISVAAVSSVRVAKTLLLSCYTGLLEVPLAELVSYLTAASILQMSEVVDKCTQAVSQFLKPVMFSNKPAILSKDIENQQLDQSWLCSSFENPSEKDVAQPSTPIQEDKTKEEGVVLGQAMYGVSQESAKVDNDNTRDSIQDMKFVKPTMESSEDQNVDLDTLKSEQSVENTTAVFKDEDFQDLISFPTFKILSAADHIKLVDISQKQQEQVGHEEKQYKNFNALKAQKEHGGGLIDSTKSNRSGAQLTKSAEDVLEASPSILAERPYLCRKCDKIFQHLENYVGHLKEHRQYSCLVCGEGFSQKSKLTYHIRVHPDVKPFRCPLCHETFIQKSLLQEHLYLHTGHKYTLNPTNKSDFRGLKRERNGESGLTDVLEEGGGAS